MLFTSMRSGKIGVNKPVLAPAALSHGLGGDTVAILPTVVCPQPQTIHQTSAKFIVYAVGATLDCVVVDGRNSRLSSILSRLTSLVATEFAGFDN